MEEMRQRTKLLMRMICKIEIEVAAMRMVYANSEVSGNGQQY